LRNEVIDYLEYWQKRTGVAITLILTWLALSTGKYYDWRKRKDRVNQHNGIIPKSHWILPWEKDAIIEYRYLHPEEGYRRLCYMMLDEDVVAVSPSTVYRVLKHKGLLLTQWRHEKSKGSGFHQPEYPHQHWHLDITYINFRGTFVYLAALIDGYSRFIVHYELKTSIDSLDVEIMLERARLKYPDASPSLITDNGPQFIAKELKNYLNEVGITHRKTRFYYPQSNGKVERFYQTCKNEFVRKTSFLSLDDLKQQLANYINIYNNHRLHSAIGYISPNDMLRGRRDEIIKERKRKLEKARLERKTRKTVKAA
jgi:transposase InsO family protein